MNIFLAILLTLAGLLILVLVAAAFMKKDHYVRREIIINAPSQKIFDFLKLLRNQEKFNKWAAADPNREWHFQGTDGTVGYVISWNGNRQAGEGAKEITGLVEGRRVETQIRFVRPMVTVANVIMETEPVSDSQTRVAFINSGSLKYPMNIFIPLAEVNFPKEMDRSLATLKTLMESGRN